MQAEPDSLVRPLRIVRHPGMRRGAVGIEVIDPAIDTEDEPAAVSEFELMSPVSAASQDRARRGLPPDELVIHRGLLSGAEIDDTSKRGAVRSAWQLLRGGRSPERAPGGAI